MIDDRDYNTILQKEKKHRVISGLQIYLEFFW